MRQSLLAAIENEFTTRPAADFRVGDTVEVHVRIREGDKERIQVFSGTVISRRHDSVRATFTVRRLVQGQGVERIFPLHSPRIARIKVTRGGQARRAKLYYLRDREGKATKVEERRLEAEFLAAQDAAAAAMPKPVKAPKAEGRPAAKKAKAPAKK